MDIFFTDPTEVPLPPQEMHIRVLRAEPYPDGRRIRVYIEVDPFQRRPNAELRILDAEGQETSSASIIETMVRKMELVMHLRGPQVAGRYTLEAELFYSPLDTQPGQEPGPMERNIVDHNRVEFEIVQVG